MSWLRMDDRTTMSVKIRGLIDPGATGDKAKDQRNATVGHWLQLLIWVAGERTDGFVTADVVELFGTRATAERLVRARFDRAPLLHKLGADGKPPTCACLEGRAWPADFEYAIHDYLDRNPSRSENDVHKAKARELRDAKLKLAVRTRDNDTCRYCGKTCKFSDRTSDDGLTYDHVDPEVADGLNNLVVACRGCNRKKGRRTPQEASMALLELPTVPPTTVAAPVATPVASADTAPVATPEPAHRADQRTEPSPQLQQDEISSQVQRSPGRDGDGLAPDTQPATPLTDSPPSTQTGPPDTYRPPSKQNPSPYRRPSQARPFPENHAGHPAQPETPTSTSGGDSP